MYKKIAVPIDLAHPEQLRKAISAAADLARLYGAELWFIGVTGEEPNDVAADIGEYQSKLADFAEAQARELGIPVTPRTQIAYDLAVDIPDGIARAVAETGADLIVMATHVPGFLDRFFSSRAGFVASHTDVSVFMVR